MTGHYSTAEHRRMDIATLLASDPTHWRTYERVIES